MIVCDYAGVAVPVVMYGLTRGFTDHEIKTSIIAKIQEMNVKFKKEYGEMVLCLEGKSWRFEVFEHYKQNRKIKKAKDDGIDWKLAHRLMDETSAFIDEYLQWKCIKHSRCEGDDIVAVLTKQFARKDSPVLILSRDSDLFQLHLHDWIKQYDTVTLKYVNSKLNAAMFLEDKILRGSSKDGVPNVASQLDHFVRADAGRQKSINEKFKREYIKDERYDQNKQLIDLDEIPFDIQREVYQMYKIEKPLHSLQVMRTNLINNKYHILANDIKGFTR